MIISFFVRIVTSLTRLVQYGLYRVERSRLSLRPMTVNDFCIQLISQVSEILELSDTECYTFAERVRAEIDAEILKIGTVSPERIIIALKAFDGFAANSSSAYCRKFKKMSLRNMLSYCNPRSIIHFFLDAEAENAKIDPSSAVEHLKQCQTCRMNFPRTLALFVSVAAVGPAEVGRISLFNNVAQQRKRSPGVSLEQVIERMLSSAFEMPVVLVPIMQVGPYLIPKTFFDTVVELIPEIEADPDTFVDFLIYLVGVFPQEPTREELLPVAEKWRIEHYPGN